MNWTGQPEFYRFGTLGRGEPSSVPRAPGDVQEDLVETSSHVPCPDCGGGVHPDAVLTHTCDPERRADHKMLGLRGEVLAFETIFRAYLNKNEGRFEAWLAARDVRRTA